ncbi:MAG TPA: alpha/beta fold hydrolase [Thermoanaerobaculia bacterium]|jgi:pimeloyl-ACP methyl ester carboxylesterase|nr:alpha/beta fold hydrolase [Thermoanaerobaculia bacterium]
MPALPLTPYAEVRRALPAARFLDLGGRQVHVEQAGAGETVVLLHGFGASTYCWRHVLPALAASYRVIAPDLHGFGATERPRDFASYTRDGQAALVLALLDQLGIERAHLVGHSYGGAISLRLAARHPERLRSLVLVDSAAPTYPNDRRRRLARLKPLAWLFLHGIALTSWSVRKALELSLADRRLVTPDLVRAYLEPLRVEGVEAAFHGLTAPLPAPDGPEIDLTRIVVPTLAVWGTEDRLVAVADGRREVLSMPQGAFVELSGVGHMPMEECPKELVRILLSFLATQTAG